MLTAMGRTSHLNQLKTHGHGSRFKPYHNAYAFDHHGYHARHGQHGHREYREDHIHYRKHGHQGLEHKYNGMDITNGLINCSSLECCSLHTYCGPSRGPQGDHSPPCRRHKSHGLASSFRCDCGPSPGICGDNRCSRGDHPSHNNHCLPQSARGDHGPKHRLHEDYGLYFGPHGCIAPKSGYGGDHGPPQGPCGEKSLPRGHYSPQHSLNGNHSSPCGPHKGQSSKSGHRGEHGQTRGPCRDHASHPCGPHHESRGEFDSNGESYRNYVFSKGDHVEHGPHHDDHNDCGKLRRGHGPRSGFRGDHSPPCGAHKNPQSRGPHQGPDGEYGPPSSFCEGAETKCCKRDHDPTQCHRGDYKLIGSTQRDHGSPPGDCGDYSSPQGPQCLPYDHHDNHGPPNYYCGSQGPYCGSQGPHEGPDGEFSPPFGSCRGAKPKYGKGEHGPAQCHRGEHGSRCSTQRDHGSPPGHCRDHSCYHGPQNNLCRNEGLSPREAGVSICDPKGDHSLLRGPNDRSQCPDNSQKNRGSQQNPRRDFTHKSGSRRDHSPPCDVYTNQGLPCGFHGYYGFDGEQGTKCCDIGPPRSHCKEHTLPYSSQRDQSYCRDYSHPCGPQGNQVLRHGPHEDPDPHHGPRGGHGPICIPKGEQSFSRGFCKDHRSSPNPRGDDSPSRGPKDHTPDPQRDHSPPCVPYGDKRPPHSSRGDHPPLGDDQGDQCPPIDGNGDHSLPQVAKKDRDPPHGPDGEQGQTRGRCGDHDQFRKPDSSANDDQNKPRLEESTYEQESRALEVMSEDTPDNKTDQKPGQAKQN